MLLQLLVRLVALFDDGHEQRIIIKFVDNAITACAGAVAGIANADSANKRNILEKTAS